MPAWDLKATPSGSSLPEALTLLPHLVHVPGERNHGRSANDWVWAAHTALEMALRVEYGIQDRLSVQFFNNGYRPLLEDEPLDPIFMGDAATVARTCLRLGRLVPWTNPGAHYQDINVEQVPEADPADLAKVYRMVRGLRKPVVEYPCYHLTDLEFDRLETAGSGAEPIKTIKERLAAGQVVVFNDSKRCTAIVGYDARGPEADHSWLILDSTGIPGDRPDGTVSRRMDSIDYGSANCRFDVVGGIQLDLSRYPETPKVLISHSSTLRLDEGEDLYLAAELNGVPPVKYQWYKDGVKLTGPAATTATYQVVSANRSHDGVYHVEAIDCRSGQPWKSEYTIVMVGGDMAREAALFRAKYELEYQDSSTVPAPSPDLTSSLFDDLGERSAPPTTSVSSSSVAPRRPGSVYDHQPSSLSSPLLSSSSSSQPTPVMDDSDPAWEAALREARQAFEALP